MRFPTAMNDEIRVRVSSEEKRFLAEVARKTGSTVSEIIRTAATEAARRIAA